MIKRCYLIFILAIILVGCAQKPIACTQEAKLCPDGSAVGRTGPNCEFADCPEIEPLLKVPEGQPARPLEEIQELI